MRPARTTRREREVSIEQEPPNWSIEGDLQEQERIRLENEVVSRIGGLDLTFENTDTHSRGTETGVENNDDDDEDDDASIEYGRHRGGRDGAYSPGGDLSISSFARGGHGAFDHTDMSFTDHSYTHTHTGHHQQHAPTLREDGDETFLKAGDTLSTAQHHASAITLGAGLGGYGPFASRTLSRSNISAREFDPERKLPDLLATRAGLSMFDESAATFAPRSTSKRSPRNPKDNVNSVPSSVCILY